MDEERTLNGSQHQEENQQQRRQEEEDEEQDEEEESPRSQPPSKVPRVSSEKSSDADAVTTAVASPLMLGLGLGMGGKWGEASESSPCAGMGGGGFTFMQMQEFHHQALIFKHMVAGIPVPIHLILPIWKSVAASYGPHHYPSFVGLGNLCYDFRNSMEPEPGRCRRTDGKKWRCSRDVVPDQKYCERHMHRGRNRSRKPVEGAAAAAPPFTATGNNSSTSNLLSITVPDDDGPTATANTNSNDVPAAARMTIGSSPTSVLSGTAACKTGASY